MQTIKKPNLLDIINDTASTVRLECVRTHIVIIKKDGIELTTSYKKGTMLPRNCIFLKPGNWRICPKKHLR